MSYGQIYQTLFETLGRPLTPTDEIPNDILVETEQRLGFFIPTALRVFYLMAGHAVDFTCAHDRFLAPKDWRLEDDKLIFMEENQEVVIYGIAWEANQNPDPPVFMTATDEPQVWHQVCQSCSEFIRVSIHWAAAFGGALPALGTATVAPALKEILDRNWTFQGQVNEMWAYGRQNQSVCFLQWGKNWRVFVGATSKNELSLLAEEFGIALDAAEAFMQDMFEDMDEK